MERPFSGNFYRPSPWDTCRGPAVAFFSAPGPFTIKNVFFLSNLLGSLSTTDLQLSSGGKPGLASGTRSHSILVLKVQQATHQRTGGRVSTEGRWRERLAGGCPRL